jgi:hypothetical protein
LVWEVIINFATYIFFPVVLLSSQRRPLEEPLLKSDVDVCLQAEGSLPNEGVGQMARL